MTVVVRTVHIGLDVLGALLVYLLRRSWLAVTHLLADKDVRRERAEHLLASTLVNLLKRLGATWIKMGQILSARPDLLPPYMIRELEVLQDDVPAEPAGAIQAIVEADLGAPISELFADFDPQPVAAASVAQVHRARLHDGSPVAVKVQRPNIEARMNRDLSIIGGAARVLNVIPGIRNLSLPAMADEFARAIKEQLDFGMEQQNNLRFAECFADWDYVRLPRLHQELSSRRVITMEWIDANRFRDAIVDPPIERALLAERIIEIYFAMGFQHKFVHADLHPGNLMMDEQGTLILLDTGLVHEIPDHYVRKFVGVLTGATLFDGRMMAESYLDGHDVPEAKAERMFADAETLMSKYRGRSYSEMEVSEATLEIFALLRKHRIFVDAEWTGFILAEVTFEGIAKMVDKDADILTLFTQKLPHYLRASGVVDENDSMYKASEQAASDAA